MIDLKVIALAALAAFVVGAGGAWYERGVRADRDLLALTNTYTKAYAQAESDARQKEQSMQRTIEALSVEGKKNEQRTKTESAAADRSTDSLLDTARVRLSSAACDPGVARRGQAATRAALLYSELLEESQRVAKQLAEEADKRGTAGRICEAYGDAVGGKK